VRPDDPNVHARFERALDSSGPKQLAKKRADNARNPEQLWLSGVYDLETLPYIKQKYAGLSGAGNTGSTHQSTASFTHPPGSHARYKPRHRLGDTREVSIDSLKQIRFERCVACAGIFECRLGDGSTVAIYAGLPGPELYTAISYVWGSTSDKAVECASCGYIAIFPCHSESKFSDMVHLAGAGSTIWLDALSIDQADPEDQARQIPAMGDIYNNASRVSVLLPACDSRAYQLLATLSYTAKEILDRPAYFIFNYEDAVAALADAAANASRRTGKQAVPENEDIYRPTYGVRATSEQCAEFVTCLQTFDAIVKGFQYWSRAWTFQEWAMASDIDLGLETDVADSQHAKIRYRPFTSVKSSIFSAASLIAQYISLEGPYAKAHFGLSRGPIADFFNLVKRLFPREAQMLAPDEVDTREYLFQSQMPSTGCYQLLGLRATPRGSELAGRRARLQIMLNAFTTSERNAKFDADLVACWAGMCSVQYEYVKEDTLLTPVRKVKSALRASGIRLFDFVPEDSECDDRRMISFFHLTRPHQLCNAKEGANFEGLPILTGRCDAGEHLGIVLAQDLRKMSTLKASGRVRQITGSVSSSALLSDVGKATDLLLGSTNHHSDDSIMFSTLRQPFSMFLRSLPVPLSELYKFVQVTIPVRDPHGKQKCLVAWALCAKTTSDGSFSIGRESVNGSLVLLKRHSRGIYNIAYLVFTDSMSGSHVITPDEQGDVDLLLNTPQRSDTTVGFRGGGTLTDDRHLRCRVDVGDYL
ncbi:hypothetical protein LTR95_012079, partial [Oleoguttula sp. CCFEE 5521]